MMEQQRRPSVPSLNGNVEINRERQKKILEGSFFLLVFRFQLPHLRAFRWS